MQKVKLIQKVSLSCILQNYFLVFEINNFFITSTCIMDTWFYMKNRSFWFLVFYLIENLFTHQIRTLSMIFRWATHLYMSLFFNPSCPNPRRREKINLNFCFHTSLSCLKRFYEGLRGLHKTFWGTTKKCENKNLS